jgi:CDP-diacylglycerol--glycerol-3-phosphate 3-phosphatidyltransferase
MAGTNRRLFPENLQNRFLRLLDPLVSALAKLGIHPNSLTLAGFVITCMAAVALSKGSLRIGGLLILLFGALLDSVIDRYSEFVIFLGIAAYFITLKNYFILAVTFVALCGSIMVSYTRARAENLGFESKVGMTQRAERIVFLGFGALIHPMVFKLSIWLVAILSNITALQRLRRSHQQDEIKND